MKTAKPTTRTPCSDHSPITGTSDGICRASAVDIAEQGINLNPFARRVAVWPDVVMEWGTRLGSIARGFVPDR